MQIIEGFDFFPLVFDRDGNLQDPDQLDALIEHAEAGAVTDAIFIAHGFRNDVNEATGLYAEFLKNFRGDLRRQQFQAIAGRQFIVAAVYWPSKTFRESFGEDEEGGGTRSLRDPALAMADAKEQLEELKKDATAAERRSLEKAEALLPKLERSPKAQDRFVELVLSVLSGSSVEKDRTEGLRQIRKRPGSELLARLDSGTTEGTRGLFGSVAGKVGQFLNLTTWYVMKDRSGTVGAKGVAPAVRALRKKRADIRVHLVGHSLGGRVMAACAKALCSRPMLQPDSMLLLQAAFSHYGFSADNGEGTPGFFRDVVEKKLVKGPFVSTYSAQDTVVGRAYAISSRLARDNSREIGDASDEFGGIGRNGALKTSEVSNAALLKPGGTYSFATGVINNLDGSGGLITSHGDVRNPAVTYAFASAVART
jgi:hypothetical protein